MAARRIPSGALQSLWSQRGVALCAEAQADGVPCTELGKMCEQCEHALVAWLDLGAPVPFRPDDIAQHAEAGR